MQNVKDILSQSTISLAQAGVDTPRLDAELLLAHVLGQERRWLWSYPEALVEVDAQHTFSALLARRCRREPLAYVLGEWEFYGRNFAVSPAVLIPRPETELLVEAVLNSAADNMADSVIDVGVGSGAIAVTLALEAPRLQVMATDLSAEALAVARRNADRYGVGERLHWAQGDLLSPLLDAAHAPVDIIVANLPYVADEEMASLMPEVGQYEPALALRAGDEGLAEIIRLVAQAPQILSPVGLLALEIGYHQAKRVEMLLAHERWQHIRFITDYAGIQRHVLAQPPISSL